MGGEDERGRAGAALGAARANPPLAPDIDSVARARGCAHGDLRIDPECPTVDLRSRRYTGRGERRIRRRCVDHDRTNCSSDVRYAYRGVDGSRLRPSPGPDLGHALVCRDLAHHPVLGELTHAADDAVPRRPRKRILHSADLELYFAQYATEILGLRDRNLCAQSRTLAQHFRLARGLVRRASLLAMDLLAKRPARLVHVAVSAAGDRPQADHNQATARPLWSCDGRHRARVDLCGSRPRQSARLAQLGTGVGTTRLRRPGPVGLLRARSPYCPSAAQPEGRIRRTHAEPVSVDRIPSPDDSVHELSDSPVPRIGAWLSRP